MSEKNPNDASASVTYASGRPLMDPAKSRVMGDAMANEILENLRRETIKEPVPKSLRRGADGVALGVSEPLRLLFLQLKQILNRFFR